MNKKKVHIRRICQDANYGYPQIAHLKNLWGYMKMADEIIEELWRIKDGIAEEYGCDVKALVAHLRSRKHEKGQQIVDLRGMKVTAERDAQADRQHNGGL